MKKTFYTYVSFLLILLLVGCSVRKDAFLNRSFHSVNAKYNVLYNGQTAYDEARALIRTYEKTDREKVESWRKASSPKRTVSFDINVCPGRIQTFVNGRVSCIQFWRIGRPMRIEYFAEDGEATFEFVKVMEDGAGYHWKGFNRPVLNQLAE